MLLREHSAANLEGYTAMDSFEELIGKYSSIMELKNAGVLTYIRYMP